MGYYNSEELFHSETYLGADYSDGLQHFKYIRRYKNSKGKWVYVYANKEKHRQIQTDLFVASNNRYDQDKYQRRADRYWNQYMEYKDSDPKFAKSVKEAYRDNQDMANLNSIMAQDREIRAYANIYKNSVSKLSEKAINNGKEAIRRAFKQLFNVKGRR